MKKKKKKNLGRVLVLGIDLAVGRQDVHDSQAERSSNVAQLDGGVGGGRTRTFTRVGIKKTGTSADWRE